jgi:hypothetical protein
MTDWQQATTVTQGRGILPHRQSSQKASGKGHSLHNQ